MTARAALSSEIAVAGRPRERQYVANIVYSRKIQQHALESHAESRVLASAVTAQVDIPVKLFYIHAASFHFGDEFAVVLFSLAAAHHFACARHEIVHSRHRFAVGILFHIKAFDVLGPVGDKNGAAEIFLGEVFFVFFGVVRGFLWVYLRVC